MTDKELLELAAKAAGYRIKRESTEGLVVWNEHNEPWIWNPLVDDGDAFRLAVKLELTICPDKKDVEVIAYEHPPTDDCHPFGIETKDNVDPYIATRRAIVRAAAEIGKEQV